MSSALGNLYQEGTWTPALSFATAGDAAFVYSTQLGKYCRIGNLVKVKVNLVFTVTYTTSSGILRCTLPIAGNGTDGIADVGALGNANNISIGAGGNVGGISLASSGAFSVLRRLQATNATATVQVAQVPSGATTYTLNWAAKYLA